ncbi:MAG: phosphatase PAP2 family protein [Psychroserpens sp.]|uniref:phosphatase PAP2 family protein n=1 Tax=Psychroserpens sp. TaxID=2020870 RepID=UPI0030026D46
MDDFIIDILNDLAHNASSFTRILTIIVHNELVKGGVVIAVLWYLWFNKKSESSHNREKIISTLFGTIIAIIVGRALANLLPYRARPILNPEFDFTYQIDEFSWLNELSSFPSDHAILFFSLATGVFLISKKWGMISYAYVLFIVCFPRIYLGFHYPTDIIGGAVIGIIIMWAVSALKIMRRLSKKTITLSIKFPGIFYACFFIFSYQIATLFNESRALISALIGSIF